VNSEGHALGTLCVMDQVPRHLAPDQVEGLRVLSRQVVAQLELRRRLRSEREQAGQKLLDRETTIEMIVGQMPAVLWSTDRDLRLTSSMGRALTAMGQRPGQSDGMTLSQYFATDDPEFLPLAAHRKA